MAKYPDRYFTLADYAYCRMLLPQRQAEASVSSFNSRAEAYGCSGVLAKGEIEDLRRQARSCFWCGTAFSRDVAISLDHVWPLSAQGPNVIENLVPACRPCNSRKSDQNPLEFARAIGRATADIETLLDRAFAAVGTSMAAQLAALRKAAVYVQFNADADVWIFMVATYHEYVAALQALYWRFEDCCVFRMGQAHPFRAVLCEDDVAARLMLQELEPQHRVVRWPDFYRQ